MITISWHLILYILLEIIGFVWALCGDDTSGGYISITTRDYRVILWIVLSIILTLIYGGIFWW